MPSPALVAFCVFGIISIVAITVQLFMCIFALRAAEAPGGEKPVVTARPATALGPLTAQILDAGDDLEAPPPRTPERHRSSRSPARRGRSGAGRVPGTRRSYRACSTRHPPLSPVSEGGASSAGSSTVICAHPESE